MTCNISNINFLKFSFSKKATKVAQSFSWFGHLPEKLIFTTSRRKESRCPGLKDASKCYRPIIHPKSLTLGSVGYFDDYIFVPWSVEISREVWWLEPINDRFSQATPVSYASAAVHRAGLLPATYIKIHLLCMSIFSVICHAPRWLVFFSRKLLGSCLLLTACNFWPGLTFLATTS